MKIQIRNNSIEVEGYVNAIERFSKKLYDARGEFIEKVMPDVFKRALENNNDVLTLLNHNNDKILARTSDGSAILEEDNIGLRAKVIVTDPKVIEKAKEGKLKGWSFGFSVNDEERAVNNDGIEERIIKDMDLYEVSILDDEKEPAYYGTSIESRDNNIKVIEFRSQEDNIEVTDETEKEEIEELTYEQKRNLLNTELYEKLKKDVCINDFSNTHIFYYDFNDSKNYKMPYEMIDNKTVNFDESNCVEVELQYVEKRSDLYIYKNKYNRLKI